MKKFKGRGGAKYLLCVCLFLLALVYRMSCHEDKTEELFWGEGGR